MKYGIDFENNSYKNIEDVKTGDIVKSWNETTGNIDNNKVVTSRQQTGSDMVKLSFGDIEIKNTFDHPYYVENKGWCSYKPKLTTGAVTDLNVFQTVPAVSSGTGASSTCTVDTAVELSSDGNAYHDASVCYWHGQAGKCLVSYYDADEDSERRAVVGQGATPS